MPKRADFILQISIRNIEDFSPGLIVKSPRIFRPQDLLNACRNLQFETSSDTPPTLLALTQFVAIDFFKLAHNTGLYNRQIKLWEGLARIAGIEIYQARKGFFSPVKMPEFDFVLSDNKKRPVALAHHVLPSDSSTAFDYLKSCRDFLKRASLYQAICGVFLCYPRPFPEKVLDYIRKEANASDNIARFESILPALGVPVNLLEIEESAAWEPADQVARHKIRLVHPDLSKKKQGASVLPGADLSSLDSSLQGSLESTQSQENDV
jgi:hypothetical protein